MRTLWRSLIRAGGTRLVRKVGKAMPVVGTAVVLGMTTDEVKKKGLVRGIVNTVLDATPIIGTAKNVIEVFTGDWLPDKPDKDKNDKDQLKRLEDRADEQP